MNDINYIVGIIKILEFSKQNYKKNDTWTIKIRAQLPQVRNNQIIHLILWDKLARSIKDDCKINDYIIMEGYLSIKKKLNNINKVEVKILKIYPAIVNYNHFGLSYKFK
jgi:hypothetical protein